MSFRAQPPSQLVQPYSPAPTTTSSLNYSAYNQTPYTSSSMPNGNPAAGGSRGVRPGINGSGGGGGSSGRSTPANGGGGGGGGGGLKPPGGERRGESKEVARTHWKALREFLASWLKEESPSARASAREKLTRLTKLQFQELSTDVYDELMRRLEAEQSTPEEAVPFLPVRDDFHPKRNQARQKLATLPRNRFKDLASDVYFELKRRYPEFEDEEGDQNYYSEPPAPGPTSRPPLLSASSAPEQNRSRINPTPPPLPLQRLQSQNGIGSHQRSGSRNISGSSINTHRSRPSRERNGLDRGDEVEQLNHQPNYPGQGQNQGQEQSRMNPIGATSEMVVPNKSRMREEEIEVPYARDSVLESTPSRSRSRASGRDRDRDSQLSAGTSISARQQQPNPTPVQGGQGHNRQLSQNSTATFSAAPPPLRSNANDVLSPTMSDDKEYYDRMSFSSNVTGKSRIPGAGVDEERERKIRQEYELRVAGLERKLGLVEAEREEMRRGLQLEKERRGEWEEEVRGLKERATTHASSLRSVQHELDIARDAAETARNHAEQTSRQGEEEISQWRDRCDGLEDELRRVEEENAGLRGEISERGGGGGVGGGGEAVDELKKEIHSLVDELNSLSARNDQLMAEREQDALGMNEMETKVEEYRRKYEEVRIELRNLKATSTMFISKPLSDDHLPASPDGNIADVNVSAFQTGIDGLLAAARSSAPSGVLPAMKSVVEAITEIGEDVKAFEAKPNLDVDSSKLEMLKHESTTRLSALMQAARNHAMASGLSPVSLLDGAAGHLSANVVEIIKLLKIRRTVRRSRSSLSIREMVGRDTKGANGAFDKEYGTVEASRPESRNQGLAPTANTSRPSLGRAAQSDRPAPGPTSNSVPHPPSSYLGNNQTLRSLQEPTSSRLRPQINSFQSAASSQARSDSFDLERKNSVVSTSFDPRPALESRSGSGYDNPGSTTTSNTNSYRERDRPTQAAEDHSSSRTITVQGGERFAPSRNRGRSSEESEASSQLAPVTARSISRDHEPVAEVRVAEADGERSPGVGYAQGEGSEEEWEELKPYLNTQSSALVNSIQNLLAAIRTNQQTPALTEHLSEVIAIASSIVAVAGNALPAGLRYEGEGLLKGLVSDTNKLSEAQEAARGGGFGKEVRQGIAAASFGVAKGLKSLMKLGVE